MQTGTTARTREAAKGYDYGYSNLPDRDSLMMLFNAVKTVVALFRGPMRASVQLLAFLIPWVIGREVFAGPFSAHGQVEFVRTHDSQLFPSWAPPVHWFTLTGVTSLGMCPTWSGRVLLAA